MAGSQVTTLRRLIGDSESPLFTRFVDLPLTPFGLEATTELATALWQQEENRYDPDAVVRLYKLSGGWPFYIYAIAARAQQVRASTGTVTDEIIDLAFQEELFGRLTHVGQHCSHLRKTATQSDSNAKTSLLEEVLKQVAAHQPLTRASLVRRLVRRYGQTEIYVAINRLIDTDFISEENGMITLLDPVFALWLAAEPIRLDPLGSLTKQRAVRKLIEWYEQRHIEDRTAMGGLFEKRVENLVRQFAGQEVDGKYFGVTGHVILPKVHQVRHAEVLSIRGKLIAETVDFVRKASQLPGVVPIALIGSLTTSKPNPKDADLLVTVTDDADLAPLAALGRRLKGRAQGMNLGADIFLRDPWGN